MENYVLNVFRRYNIRLGVRIKDITVNDMEKIVDRVSKYEFNQITIANNMLKLLYEHVWDINPTGVLPLMF
jgi:hypothetical protein